MKVALLTPELFSAEGGLSRILRLYLKALCDWAVEQPDREVRLVSLIDPTFDSTDLRRYANERLVDWAACRRSKLSFVRAAFAAARASDLLVCGHIGQLPVAALARRRYPRCQYVLVAHGLEVWRRFGPVERLALAGTREIWCVSEFTRRELLRHAHLPPERAQVVPNALDPYFESAESIDPRPSPTLLTIARLTFSDRYKGVDHLIEALPGIRERVPGATLRVIGRGDDLPRLQTLAAQRGVLEHVMFLGFLADDEMRRELASCRVFALPSEREGFGLVYLEAMAHGKPCVGAQAGGTPEVISPESGLLCPYGDVPALTKACVRALESPWDAAAIRARAARFSYAHFRDTLKGLLSG